MRDTKTKDRELEQIAFGKSINWEEESKYGTIFFGPEMTRTFPPMNVGTAETLLEKGYIDTEYSHNNAPNSARLVSWAGKVQHEYKSYDLRVGMIGYMVSPDRPDSRLAFTGVTIDSPTNIPESLKREVGREFTPDLIAVDDFNIEVRWD
ncbi:hypothetical protein [Halovenus marina]|uniref:hypothetical protein n=1 Tax=Halovenus marina TaxID=3396621 RepID=UPI003F54C4B9